MRNRHNDWKTDIALRMFGAASCGISYLAIRALMGMRLADGQLPDDALPFILAAAGFLFASVGSAFLALGHHIFDEVEINQRWRNPLPVDGASREADVFAPGDTRCGGRFPSVTINQDNIREFDLVRRA